MGRPLTGKLGVTAYSVTIQWGTFTKGGGVRKYRSTLQGEGMLSHTRSKKPLGRGCGLCFYGKSSEDREQTEASRPGIGRKYERITNVLFFPGVGRGMELVKNDGGETAQV